MNKPIDKPTIIANVFTEVNGIHPPIETTVFDTLLKQVPWIKTEAPRKECFMATTPLKYGYDTSEGTRFYESCAFHPIVFKIMTTLNGYNTQYNVCFLNYYENEKQHLGWHADDSPEMDLDHPIAVVSFGAERYIYVKEKTFKGELPPENKFLLENGSIFIMPAGYQRDHLHKIPKGDRPMGGRISLTFRKFVQ